MFTVRVYNHSTKVVSYLKSMQSETLAEAQAKLNQHLDLMRKSERYRVVENFFQTKFTTYVKSYYGPNLLHDETFVIDSNDTNNPLFY